MCEFINYEIRSTKTLRNKTTKEEWEAEPELEKVQEEKKQQQLFG